MTAFRRIIISSGALSPLMGSSAFVFGMRNHQSHTLSTTTGLHAYEMSYSTAVPSNCEQDCEFDFIEAATQAAIEREATQEAPARIPARVYEMPVYSAPTEVAATTMPSEEEEDYEFDFLAAATQAAVERESREAQIHGAAEADHEVAPFKVYPAFYPRATSQSLMRND